MLFRSENFKKCQETIIREADVEAKEDLIEIIKSFIDYPEAVTRHEKTLKSRLNHNDSSARIQSIQKADLNRRIVHNKAIANCALLNRMAELYKAGKIFTGNINIRYEVGDFCEEVAEKFYRYETQKNIYNHENYKIFTRKANDIEYSLMNELLTTCENYFFDQSKKNVDLECCNFINNDNNKLIHESISSANNPLKVSVESIIHLSDKYHLDIFTGDSNNDDDIKTFCAEIVSIPFKERH